jgi:nitrite reductase/ring-hydroxylating ferredoxin subunit
MRDAPPIPIASAPTFSESVLVCRSDALLEGKGGIRFPVEISLGNRRIAATGFVIRFSGTVFGYLNQCAHVAMELDWKPGEFFDADGLYLMCSTHGAAYRPEDGYCVSGPCIGQRLQRLKVSERDGRVHWWPCANIGAPVATISR